MAFVDPCCRAAFQVTGEGPRKLRAKAQSSLCQSPQALRSPLARLRGFSTDWLQSASQERHSLSPAGSQPHVKKTETAKPSRELLFPNFYYKKFRHAEKLKE